MNKSDSIAPKLLRRNDPRVNRGDVTRSQTAPSAELEGLVDPGQSLALLKALHILTADGRINQDSRRKLKQVKHLCQFIEPLISQALSNGSSLTLVDHGAGKSYLGFLLYDLYLRQLPSQQSATVIGIETRAELVSKANELAKSLNFSGMQFLGISAADSLTCDLLPATVDIVTALHACDTATDDAIAFGLAKKAKHLVIVPCCQAEVASTLRKYKSVMLGRTALSELWRHPLHTREMGAQLSNVLRCLGLQAAGYQVSVTELVGWEHSMKNELIIATKLSNKHDVRADAVVKLDALLTEFNLQDLRHRFLPQSS